MIHTVTPTQTRLPYKYTPLPSIHSRLTSLVTSPYVGSLKAFVKSDHIGSPPCLIQPLS